MKKLVIAGGSGFLGQALIAHFEKEFSNIIVLTRGKNQLTGNTEYVSWDAKNPGDWCRHLEGADVIINLCGKSVDCRYTEKNKKIILSSRVDSTKVIGETILKCKTPPKLWINGASATIYRHSENEPMTEKTGVAGSGFSVEVCKAWENVFNSFQLPYTRKVNMRISMVLGKDGGVFPVLLNLTRKGLGGTMGKGTQQVSWVHVDDYCRTVRWFVDHETTNGVYNIVSPKPVRNKELMRLLRKKTGIPFGLPATSWMLDIGAFFIRTETELILKSRYAYPERLLQEGFEFEYPEIEKCVGVLVQ